MSLKFHEISEASLLILNPFSDDKLQLLGDICKPNAGSHLLDLASGKGELLCQWSARFGLHGLGVDVSSVFVEAARLQACQQQQCNVDDGAVRMRVLSWSQHLRPGRYRNSSTCKTASP